MYASLARYHGTAILLDARKGPVPMNLLFLAVLAAVLVAGAVRPADVIGSGGPTVVQTYDVIGSGGPTIQPTPAP